MSSYTSSYARTKYTTGTSHITSGVVFGFKLITTTSVVSKNSYYNKLKKKLLLT